MSMLFSAEQFKKTIQPSEYGQTWNDVPASNLFHARGKEKMTELEESIKTEGVKKPVLVDRDAGFKVVNGHHRAAIALHYGLDIPVEFKERDQR